MGILGLFDLIRGSGGGTTKVTLKDFAGKMVVIDAGNWSYRKFFTSSKKVVEKTELAVEMPDPLKIRNEYFREIYKKLMLYLNYDVTPCFVFDGEPREEKKDTREKRHSDKAENIEKIEEYTEQLKTARALEISDKKVEEMRKILIKTPHPDFQSLKAFQKFLDALGLPWLVAKHDAEQLCAILCSEGLGDAVETQDGDGLAFGAKKLIIESGGRWEKDDEDTTASPVYDMVELDVLLENLGLDFPAFVDMCILAKCDYNKGITGIGIKRAYPLIKEFGSIDNIPRLNKKTLDRSAMAKIVKGLPIKNGDYSIKLLRYKRCREIFQFVSSDYFIAKGTYDMREVNEPELRAVLEKYSIKLSMGPLIRAKEKLSPPEVGEHQPIYLL